MELGLGRGASRDVKLRGRVIMSMKVLTYIVVQGCVHVCVCVARRKYKCTKPLSQNGRSTESAELSSAIQVLFHTDKCFGHHVKLKCKY